jgi:hypothetical protein
MKRTFPRLTNTVILLATAIEAAAIGMRLSSDGSWWAYVGWIIFFAALQSPYWFGGHAAYKDCLRWLRFGKGGGER